MNKQEMIQEQEANNFAMALLMPEYMVLDFISKKTMIEDMAIFFGVSEFHMTARVLGLGFTI